jgi:protein arginine kinase
LEGLPFKTKKQGAFDAVAETIKSKNKNFLSTSIRDLGSDMAKALFEQHLISKEFLANRSNGVIVVKNNNKVCIMLGEEDHMRIQTIELGFALETAYDESFKIAGDIAGAHEIAYRNDIGYLTSCPTNLGCAMRASVMVFLPALTMTGQIDGIIDKLSNQRITVRGVYGEGSSAVGNMYQISNQACLGLSESQILENVKNVTLQIVKIELELQRKLYKNSPDEIIDQVFRAYGLLTSAYMLSSAEAVENLASLKLGACLDIIKFKNNRILDDLFFIIQPATLQSQDDRANTAVARDKIRAQKVADYLRTSRIK